MGGVEGTMRSGQKVWEMNALGWVSSVRRYLSYWDGKA